MMRENYCIDSNEWYIPKNWDRTSLDNLLAEKQDAVNAAEKLFDRLKLLKEKIVETEYKKLWTKFCNLKLVTKIWYLLAVVFMDYVKYFETNNDKYASAFEKDLCDIENLSDMGKALLGDNFYCINGDFGQHDFIKDFIEEIKKSFYLEKETVKNIKSTNNILDYIICGGGLEGHHLQKEVNFSDTCLRDDGICRIPGNSSGAEWSSINAHGWFSYSLSVRPRSENIIKIVMGSLDKQLDINITIGDDTHIIREQADTKKEFTFHFTECEGKDTVRIRFDKISEHIPCVFEIKSYL